jgi:RNA recognition motif-containing protein
MRPKDSRGSGRRGRGPRRSPNRSRGEARTSQTPAPQTLWQKIVAFFKPDAKRSAGSASRSNGNGSATAEARTSRKPEAVEVNSPKLYVGNLSYDATESDLFDLFKGVGAVRNAEVVTHRQTERSKGFGFVTMSTVDEAKRAVVELHDREFMGRKLVVSGSKSSDREPNYRG